MPMSVSFAPQFCPNADILFELQVEQPPDAAHANHCLRAKAPEPGGT